MENEVAGLVAEIATLNVTLATFATGTTDYDNTAN
jgi:hypothetical protein